MKKVTNFFCIRADCRSILKQIRHNAFTADGQYKQKLFSVIVNNYAVLKIEKRKVVVILHNDLLHRLCNMP